MPVVFVVIKSRLRRCFGEVSVLMGPRDKYFVRGYKSIDEAHKSKE